MPFTDAQLLDAHRLPDSVKVTQTEPSFYRVPPLTGKAVGFSRVLLLMQCERPCNQPGRVVGARYVGLSGLCGWLFTDGSLWLIRSDTD